MSFIFLILFHYIRSYSSKIVKNISLMKYPLLHYHFSYRIYCIFSVLDLLLFNSFYSMLLASYCIVIHYMLSVVFDFLFCIIIHIVVFENCILTLHKFDIESSELFVCIMLLFSFSLMLYYVFYTH